ARRLAPAGGARGGGPPADALRVPHGARAGRAHRVVRRLPRTASGPPRAGRRAAPRLLRAAKALVPRPARARERGVQPAVVGEDLGCARRRGPRGRALRDRPPPRASPDALRRRERWASER